jgi:ketosteroid isomerase-like protein
MTTFSTCSAAKLCFVATVFVTAACQKDPEVERQESEADVVDAVLQRTDQWAEAARRRDAAGVLDLFINSDELRHAENGVIFPSYEALAEFVKGWFDGTEEMELVWEQREVVPLSADAATMTGMFRYEARQESGEVWAGRNVFTGVFVRRGASWALIHGHESSVPASQEQ